MAQPPEYVRQYSFTGYSQSNPDALIPGTKIDQELNAVKQTSDAIRTNLALIQRDDGALANDSVGVEQMKPEVTLGLNSVEAWVSGTDYIPNNGVWYEGVLYRCTEGHTADADFAVDLAADRWSALLDIVSMVDAAAAATDVYAPKASPAFTGPATFAGNVTLGDASSDSVTVNAGTVSIPNGVNFSGGNVGVGITPAAWGSTYEAIEAGAASLSGLESAAATVLWNNAYYDGTNQKRKFTGPAHALTMDTSGFTLSVAGTASGGSSITYIPVLTVDMSGSTKPASDNTYSCGTASFRWSEIFAGTGTINTSDAIEKEWRGPFTAAELAVGRRIIEAAGVYQWLARIAEKGAGEARLHAGPTAQAVAAAFEAEGLDPYRYGCVGFDALEDGTVRFNVRPDQLMWFVCASLDARLAALEAA